MKLLRIIQLILGSLMTVVGLAMLAGAAGLGWAEVTQRDSEGFYATSDQRFATTTHALTSTTIDFGMNADGSPGVAADIDPGQVLAARAAAEGDRRSHDVGRDWGRRR